MLYSNFKRIKLNNNDTGMNLAPEIREWFLKNNIQIFHQTFNITTKNLTYV